MRNFRCRCVGLIFSVLLYAAVAVAQGTFTKVDVTGAGTGMFQGTAALGIDTAGDIAGVYLDTAAQPVAVSANPVAKIAGASLTDAADGSGDRVLPLTGTDFVSNSMVEWKGVGIATTYVSPWSVSAVVTVVNNASDTSGDFDVH